MPSGHSPSVLLEPATGHTSFPQTIPAQEQMFSKLDHVNTATLRSNQCRTSDLARPVLCGLPVPAKTRHCPNVEVKLVQRRRRWANIRTTFGQCLVLAVICMIGQSSNCTVTQILTRRRHNPVEAGLRPHQLNLGS